MQNQICRTYLKEEMIHFFLLFTIFSSEKFKLADDELEETFETGEITLINRIEIKNKLKITNIFFTSLLFFITLFLSL